MLIPVRSAYGFASARAFARGGVVPLPALSFEQTQNKMAREIVETWFLPFLENDPMNLDIVATNPTGCGHIHLVVNGEPVNIMVADFTEEPASVDAAVRGLVRHLAKQNNVTTFGEIKNLLEAKTWKV